MKERSPELTKIREKLYVENDYGYEHQNLDARLTKEDVDYLMGEFDGIKPDLHPMCINCQARQVIKYDGHLFNEKKTKGFIINCEGVPAGLPPGSRDLLRKMITEQNIPRKRAMLYLKSTVDPVSWCELMFGFDDSTDWHLRPYQKEQIRCTAKRIAVREGRRSGKTFAMAMKIIYLAFNDIKEKGLDSEGNPVMEGPEIMIITPYQAQVSNIFNEIEKILKRNRDLTKEVTTGTGGSLYVKTPFFKLELSNGAKISGFVSGVGNKDDGSGGGTMRGQAADWIYTDEVDMIPDEILDKVVIPIMATTDNVGMLSTSTPIGKRGKFYEWCKERPDFKEDYFPSTVLPHWSKISNEIIADSTKDGFAAEYMAHFIEGSYGVFRPSLVYRAMGAYTYADSDLGNHRWWREQAKVRDRKNLMKVIGIDWNKNAGTEFVVVAYDPSQHHWWVVESTNISSGEYNSVRFKEEVVRLNFKWKPQYIYADEGYGHHIIDDLQHHAHLLKSKPAKTPLEEETAKLAERLKAFNFSSKVELRSPIDHTIIKKTAKEFLVENSIRVFEEQKIWFPEDDKSLLDQLLNYVVLRRSPTTNKPVYGAESHRVGDHRLDALMLALGGLFLENSLYSNNAMPASLPSQLTKDALDDRAEKFNHSRVHGVDVLRAARQAGIPAALTVLDLVRGGNLKEDQHVRNIQAAEQELNSGGWFRKGGSRGDIGRHANESIFETIAGRTNSSAGYDTDEEAVWQVAAKRRSKSGGPSAVKRRGRSGSSRKQLKNNSKKRSR
jgi:hypothetical protein